MTQRQDALAAAAQWMVLVEQLTREQASGLVATIGTLQCASGAANVIPGEVRLTLDVRGPEEKALTALLANVLSHGEQVAQTRGCRFEAEEYYRIAPTRCDDGLQRLLREAVTQVQGRAPSLPSGAGHDAIAIAERWPVGMLFVRCKGGIIHHPDESITMADVAQALRAWLAVVFSFGEK